MQTSTRSAIALFATLYTLAVLAGSPSARLPLEKIFQKSLPAMSISVDSVRRTSRADDPADITLRISLDDQKSDNSSHHIKECSMQINPYLNFNGNCKEAFETYERVFKGKIEAMLPHAGTPAEQHTPAEWRDKILHARLSVNGQVLMASDVPPQNYKPLEGFAVSLGITDLHEAERVFRELSEGGRITMPLQPTFWALGFGMLTDRFGIPWMINCDKPAA
jgi:PhnB protein